MFKKLYLSTPSAQAREIADILRLALTISNTTVDVGLGFDSPAQAGQYQRRIKEALLEAQVDPEIFSFIRPKDSSALEISYTGAGNEDDVAATETDLVIPPTEKPAASLPPASSATCSGRFLESKAVLQELTTADKPSGSYVVATLLIVDGDEKGQSFQDWLRRFPPHGRLPRFAEAFGVSLDDLTSRPSSLVGSPVWVRRRKLTLPNGTSKTETLYYHVSAAGTHHPVAV